MLKQLTLAAFAAALLPACILTTDNTTTDDSTSATGSATDSASSGASKALACGSKKARWAASLVVTGSRVSLSASGWS